MFFNLNTQIEIKGVFCFVFLCLLAVLRVRVIGSSTLALCHLASGAADAYYQFGLHCWDLAAATVIIREAGGTVIDTSGECSTPGSWTFGGPRGCFTHLESPQYSFPVAQSHSWQCLAGTSALSIRLC